MSRKIYQLTAKDVKKATTLTEAEYNEKLADFDKNKADMGKKFGLKKRDYAVQLLRSTAAYIEGKGQGALDLAHNLGYSADTNSTNSFQNAYNLGYHNGFTSPANIRDLIAHNPNFSHLQSA